MSRQSPTIFVYFASELIVSQLSGVDFQTHSHELLVYLVGSIRFLTQNHYKVLEKFVKLGTIGQITRIMASVNEAVSIGNGLDHSKIFMPLKFEIHTQRPAFITKLPNQALPFPEKMQLQSTPLIVRSVGLQRFLHYSWNLVITGLHEIKIENLPGSNLTCPRQSGKWVS